MKTQSDIQPTVAYVVVCWNNRDLLEECLESIKAQDYPSKKIIIVDNDSKDDSVAFIKKSYPEVELVELDKNQGFAIGNNRGIDKALEDKDVAYVALVNTDATLSPNWTSVLVEAAERKPLGATFQSVTLDYYDHNIIDSTHIYIARNGQATQGSWRRPVPGGYDVAPQKVFGCNAAAVVISRRFIEAQPFEDFFDKTMWMYLEDVDVAARATVMGWSNYVVPGARAYHMGSASSGKNPGFSLYMTFRNNSGLLIKNMPFKLLFKMAPALIRGDIDTIIHLRRTGRSAAIKKVLKGRLVALLYLPIFLRKRSQLSHLRNVDNGYLWQLMCRGF